MRAALLAFLLSIPLAAQSNSVFAATGLNIVAPTSGLYSLGVAHSINSTQDVFLDVILTPNAPTRAQATTLMLGLKQNLPVFNLSVWKLHFTARPFVMLAYGATLADTVSGEALQGIKIPGSVTVGSVVGALSTAPGLTQEYGGGFTKTAKHFNWGFGARAMKETGIPWVPQPFVFVAKTF
jgi:hypothetical protein